MPCQQPESRPRRQLGSGSGWLPHNRAYGPTRGLLRTIVTLSLSTCADDRASAPSPGAPSGFDPGLERRAEFVGILLSKGRSRRSSVESERNRSDVPRHDIAAQVARRSTRSQAVALLSYKDIRE